MTDIQGVNEVLAAAEQYVRVLQQRANNAMVEITGILQASAQLTHTFENQSGNLEGSIKGAAEEEIAGAAGEIVRGYLMATMSYAQFVELANDGAYAFLLPVIEAHHDEILEILKRHLEG